MAKWGEGDPRWLVEHREDGKNVNGWHWAEKNMMAWTKQRLGELLPGTACVAGDDWEVSVTAVKSVTGEAMLTTRKGNKRFAFYDLKLTLAWEARPAGAAAEAGEAPAGAAGAAGGEGAGTVADADGAEEGGSGPPLISGELAVAEFGSGSDHDDIEISASVGAGGAPEQQAGAKRAAEGALWAAVLARLEQYVSELSEA